MSSKAFIETLENMVSVTYGMEQLPDAWMHITPGQVSVGFNNNDSNGCLEGLNRTGVRSAYAFLKCTFLRSSADKMHLCIHACMRAGLHACMYTYANVTCMQTHTTHTCTRAHTSTHTHACMLAHMHACTHAHARKRTHACMQAHTHARTHARTHAHTHTHTH